MSTYDLFETPIASGLSGTIYSTRDGKYALKFINYANHKFTELNWIVEISVLNHMRHRKIVPLREVIETKQGCFLVMPRLLLLDRINTKAFKDRVQEQIALDIGEALAYLHQWGLIHTDIKKKNALISVKNKTFVSAVLCDMGAVKATSVAMLLQKNVPQFNVPRYMPKNIVSERYMVRRHQYYLAYPPCARPPEVMKKDCITIKSDVWSYGCFLTSLAKGGIGINMDDCPSDTDWQEYLDKTIEGPLKPVIKACLAVDPVDRPSMTEAIGVTNIANVEHEATTKDTLIDVIGSLPIDCGTFRYLKSLVMEWSEKAIITSDCVEFCRHLITKTVQYPQTKVYFENNAYLPVIICMNIALQLFHPQVRVDLCKIYNVSNVDDDLGPEYVQSVMWIFREVFRYDLFN